MRIATGLSGGPEVQWEGNPVFFDDGVGRPEGRIFTDDHGLFLRSSGPHIQLWLNPHAEQGNAHVEIGATSDDRDTWVGAPGDLLALHIHLCDEDQGSGHKVQFAGTYRGKMTNGLPDPGGQPMVRLGLAPDEWGSKLHLWRDLFGDTVLGTVNLGLGDFTETDGVQLATANAGFKLDLDGQGFEMYTLAGEMRLRYPDAVRFTSPTANSACGHFDVPDGTTMAVGDWRGFDVHIVSSSGISMPNPAFGGVNWDDTVSAVTIGFNGEEEGLRVTVGPPRLWFTTFLPTEQADDVYIERNESGNLKLVAKAGVVESGQELYVSGNGAGLRLTQPNGLANHLLSVDNGGGLMVDGAPFGAAFPLPQYTMSTRPGPGGINIGKMISVKDPGKPELVFYSLTQMDGTIAWTIVTPVFLQVDNPTDEGWAQSVGIPFVVRTDLL
jgi:hypothetical protein